MAFLIDAVGPTVARTFTFPDQNATMLTSAAAVTVAQGGTGIASYAVGDLLYASGATTLSKLADVAVGSVLVSGGVAAAPLWSANPTLGAVTVNSLTFAAAGFLGFTGRSFLDSPVNGNFRMTDSSGTTFGLLQLGGVSASEPALKRSGASLRARLADDSADTSFIASAFVVGTNPAATGAIRMANNTTIMGRNAANSADIPLLNLYVDDNLYFGNTGTHFVPNASNSQDLGFSTFIWRTGRFGTSLINAGFYEGTEMTAPAAPAADKGRLYFEDNGSGKTRLMCLFSSGAAQQIAIQP